MANTRLKKYLEIKQDPHLATLKMLEQAEAMAKNIAERAINEQIQDLKRKYELSIADLVRGLEKQIPVLTQAVTKKLTEHVIKNKEEYRGADGISIKGDKGERGERGEKGEKGDKGDKGDPGTTPIAGVDFPTKEEINTLIKSSLPKEDKKIKLDFKEIARGIESLPEKEKLDYYRGLKNTPTNNNTQSSRGIIKGGGMGNWEHEVFNTSSATTSITLAKNVAANGSAILVRYQGQMLAHGIQYTISGRIITPTFTLGDSTFIEVTYVRA